MKLDHAIVGNVVVAFRPSQYKRIFPVAHLQTPLGTGLGRARFSSDKRNFGTLYAAVSLATAIAETIIRDNFEGKGAVRRLFASELRTHCVASISATRPLQLLDLRTDGCFKLGVSTDIAGAKQWDEARELAQRIHDETSFDGFLYRSRLTGENCIAVFNRAIPGTLIVEQVRDLTALPELRDALAQLNTVLLL